jgi:hypothetical protein
MNVSSNSKTRSAGWWASVVAGAALAGMPLAGGATEPGKPVYYAGGHLGVNNLDTWPAQVDFGAGVRVDGRLALDRGGHQGLVIGRQTEKGRFELEYQRGDAELTSISLGSVSEAATGRLRYEALTVNAYRTRAFDAAWTGFFGVGLGWGSVKTPKAGFTSGCECFSATSEGGFVYQARLGLEYGFGQGHKAFAQYTWLSLPGGESGGVPGIDYPRRGVGALSIGYRKTF